MKKIVLIVFLIWGCSKDEDTGCECEAKYSYLGQDGSYYVPKTKINCETRKPLNNFNGSFMGCKD